MQEIRQDGQRIRSESGRFDYLMLFAVMVLQRERMSGMIWLMPRACTAAVLGLATLLCACQPPDPDWANKAALRIGAPRGDADKIRERQTQRFPGIAEERLLVEATQVLQDLGFTVEESAPRHGVIAGSKDRDATETGQVVGQVALAVGLALLGVHYTPTWDSDQVIRATLTSRLSGPRETALRISFERIVTNTNGASRVEVLTDPEFSEGFFEKVRAGLARRA